MKTYTAADAAHELIGVLENIQASLVVIAGALVVVAVCHVIAVVRKQGE